MKRSPIDAPVHIAIIQLVLSVVLIGVEGSEFYLDSAVSLGAQNDGTSWDKAWKHPNDINWEKVQGGDTIWISGGNISKSYYGEWVIPGKASFTAIAPLKIRVGNDPNHDGIVVFDGGNGLYSTNGVLLIQNASHIQFSGLGTDGNKRWVFKDFLNTNLVTATYCAGIASVNPNTGIEINNIIITNANNGISLNGASRCVIRDCILGAIQGDHAIGLGVGKPLLDDNVVSENYIEITVDPQKAWYGPDGISGQNGVTAISNKVFGVIGNIVGAQHQDAFQLSGSCIRILNNRVENMGNSMVYVDQGIRSPEVWHDYWVANNVISLTDTSFLSTYTRGVGFRMHERCNTFSNVFVINNSFVDLPKYAAIEIFHGSLATKPFIYTNVFIMNNLIYNCGGGAWIPAIFGRSEGVLQQHRHANGMTIDRNAVVAAQSGNSDIIIGGERIVQKTAVTLDFVLYNYQPFKADNDYRVSLNSTTELPPLFADVAGVDLYGQSRTMNYHWFPGATIPLLSTSAGAPQRPGGIKEIVERIQQ
jgi:hypothetical protein